MRDDSKSITELARELRNNPTSAERKLWSVLRKRKLNGYRFLRQKPIIYAQRNSDVYFFIADFYCHEKRLVLEVDGGYHHNQKEYDKNRDLVIRQLGLTVLRIRNEELANLTAVKKKITAYLN